MPEQQNIEYKSSWHDEYLKWICGFANAQGGKIFLGLDDNGQVIGLDDYTKLMDEIPNKVIAHLGIVTDVNLHNEENKYYIEIDVNPSSVAISYHGAYYYRSGSTKQELKGTALQEFLLKKIGKTWDDIPQQKATLKEIDTDAIASFRKLAIETGRISKESIRDNDTQLFLTNLHLVDEDGKLKNAAILLFGHDPLKYFTTAYFKIGRFGHTDDDLKFQDIVEGNILDMADKVLKILKSMYLVSPIRYEGLHRIEELEYPEEALREAILNAIVHKDYTDATIQLSVYDDKLILWNPGKLPADLSINALKEKHASKPRNKNIAEMFFKAGFIEVWGRGIAKILTACKDAGLPEPLIEEKQGGISITFFKDFYTEDYLKKLGLNNRQIKAVMFTKEQGAITNPQYQELNNIGKSVSNTDLQDLIIKNIIMLQGKGKTIKYILKINND